MFCKSVKKREINFYEILSCLYFLNFLLCSYSFSQSDFTTSAEKNSVNPVKEIYQEAALQINSKANDARNSVWRIRNHSNYFMGTAFSIGLNLFVTNFHVLEAMLEDENSIKNITLQQKGDVSHLTIKKVVAVSALYDLALFEIRQDVTNYLNVSDSPIRPSEELFMLGYPQGDFKEMKKTGQAVDNGYHYTFSVNHFPLLGSSGSPVLNTKGQVVGVSSLLFVNMSSIVKSKHLKELIAGDTGLNCSDIIHLAMCIKQEIETLKKFAEQGDALAQYILAKMPYGKQRTDKDIELEFGLMKKSAEQGYALAQYGLAAMYYNGEREIKKDHILAFIWMKKSAEQDFASAQYELAMMYYKGKGTERNLELAFSWMQQSAEQGYALAQDELENMTRYWGQDNELVFY